MPASSNKIRVRTPGGQEADINPAKWDKFLEKYPGSQKVEKKKEPTPSVKQPTGAVSERGLPPTQPISGSKPSQGKGFEGMPGGYVWAGGAVTPPPTPIPTPKKKKEIYQEDSDNVLMNAIKRGLNQADLAAQMTATGGDPTMKINEEIARIQRENRQLKSSEAYQKFNNATTTKEAWAALTESPTSFATILAELSLESLTAQAKHGLIRAGAGAATGAAVGSVIPGAGTAAGAGVGILTGLGLASLNLEYSGKMLEVFDEMGFDTTNPLELEKAFSDEKKVDEARNTALRKGIPVAVFDMVSGGLAGRIATKPAKSLLGKVATEATEIGTQAGLGMAGEATGQVVAGEKINPAAILAEGIGELGPGTAEIIGGRVYRKIAQPKTPKEAVSTIVAAASPNADKAALVKDQIDLSLMSGEIDDAQAVEYANEAIKAIESDKSVPLQIEGIKRVDVLPIIIDKSDVQNEISQLEKQKETTDAAFHPMIDTEINTRRTRIDELTRQIQSILTAPTEVAPTTAPAAPVTETDRIRTQILDEIFKDSTAQNKADALEQRMNNAEEISMTEINDVLDGLYGQVETIMDNYFDNEAGKQYAQALLDKIDKIKSYEFATDKETAVVTERKAVQTARASLQETASVINLARAPRATATITSEDGTTGTYSIEVGPDGAVTFEQPNTEPIRIGNVNDVNKTASIVETVLNEQGLPQSVSFSITGEDGRKHTITVEAGKKLKPQQLLDLAINIRANELGTVDPADFDTAYEEVTREITTTKPKTDAVQVETAGQVPVQPEAGTRQEMAEGKPQAEPQAPTKEGVKEEVTAPKKQSKADKLNELQNQLIRAKINSRIPNILKALQSVGVKIEIIEDPAEYDRIMRDEYGNNYISAGVYVAESGKIYLNPERMIATGEGVKILYHEATHPVLNIIRNTNKPLYDRMVRAMEQAEKASTGKNREAFSKLKKFGEAYEGIGYDESQVNDEKLTELLALIGNGDIDLTKLPKSFTDTVIDFLNQIAKFLGIKARLTPTSDMGALRQVAKDIKNSFDKGVDIGEFLGYDNKGNIDAKDLFVNEDGTPFNQMSLSNKFVDLMNGVVFEYIEDTEDFNKLKSQGIITDDKKLSDYEGYFAVLHIPDNAFTGKAFKDNELILDGKGGVYFPIRFNDKGYFWASTSNAAKSLANILNESRMMNPDGKIRMALISTEPKKILSSSNASTGVMEILFSKAFDKRAKLKESNVIDSYVEGVKIANIEFISMFEKKIKEKIANIKKAKSDASRMKMQKNLSDFKKKGPTKAPKLTKSMSADNIKAILNEFFSPDNSSFREREAFNTIVLDLIAQKVNNIDKVASERYGKELRIVATEVLSFLGMTKNAVRLKSTGGRLSAANLVQGFSDFMMEPMLKGEDKNKVYAILEVDSEVEAVSIGKEHGSYDYAVKPIDKKAKITLNILQDRLDWKDNVIDPETNQPMDPERASNVLPTYGVSPKPVKLAVSQMSLYTATIDGVDVELKGIDVDVVNGFYSPLEQEVFGSKQDKMPAKKWLDRFKGREEAKWTGLNDWLDSQEGAVSKQDILDYMKENRIVVSEVVMGAKDYSQRIKEIENEIDKEGYYFELDMGGEGYMLLNKETDDLAEYEELPERIQDMWNEYNEIQGPEFNAYSNIGGKYSQYQLEGEKENYREVLVTLPSKIKPYSVIDNRDNSIVKTFDKYSDAVEFIESSRFGDNYDVKEDKSTTFQSSHFDEPNILVHLRMNERTDAEGNKVLFLEEVQSDWAQKGRREGFDLDKKQVEEKYNQAQSALSQIENKIENKYGKDWDLRGDIDEVLSKEDYENYRKAAGERAKWGNLLGKEYKTGIPTAPFVMNTSDWVKLAMRVALKEAVKSGANSIAWTTGEQQNDRFDLSKTIDELFYQQLSDGKGNLIDRYYIRGTKNQTRLIEKDNLQASELEQYVGKEVAEKIINGETEGVLKGIDLKVGGKGMIGFYGTVTKPGIVGQVASKLFGQEVVATEINGVEQPSVKVTPQMKAEVKRGLPQMSLMGTRMVVEKPNEPTLKAAGLTPSEVEQWKKKNKVSQREGRVTGVQKSAQDLYEGKITVYQHIANVRKEQPARTYQAVPQLPSYKDVTSSLAENQMETGVVGLNKGITQGTQVGARLDIPSFNNYGTNVVSIHEATGSGKAIGYGRTASLSNVKFKTSPSAALKVAMGESKGTWARMIGSWNNESDQSVVDRAKQAISSGEWIQIGINPFRHSWFYNRATGMPVMEAAEVLQVGNMVLARGARELNLNNAKDKAEFEETFKVKLKSGAIGQFSLMGERDVAKRLEGVGRNNYDKLIDIYVKNRINGRPLRISIQDMMNEEPLSLTFNNVEPFSREPYAVQFSDGWPMVRLTDGRYTDGDLIYESWDQLIELNKDNIDEYFMDLETNREIDVRNDVRVKQIENNSYDSLSDIGFWNKATKNLSEYLGYTSPMQMQEESLEDAEIAMNLTAKAVDLYNEGKIKTDIDFYTKVLGLTNEEAKSKIKNVSFADALSQMYVESKKRGSNPELVKAVEDAIDKPRGQASLVGTRGIRPTTREDVEAALSRGDRVIATLEMDDEPIEITSMAMVDRIDLDTTVIIPDVKGKMKKAFPNGQMSIFAPRGMMNTAEEAKRQYPYHQILVDIGLDAYRNQGIRNYASFVTYAKQFDASINKNPYMKRVWEDVTRIVNGKKPLIQSEKDYRDFLIKENDVPVANAERLKKRNYKSMVTRTKGALLDSRAELFKALSESSNRLWSIAANYVNVIGGMGAKSIYTANFLADGVFKGLSTKKEYLIGDQMQSESTIFNHMLVRIRVLEIQRKMQDKFDEFMDVDSKIKEIETASKDLKMYAREMDSLEKKYNKLKDKNTQEAIDMLDKINEYMDSIKVTQDLIKKEHGDLKVDKDGNYIVPSEYIDTRDNVRRYLDRNNMLIQDSNGKYSLGTYQFANNLNERTAFNENEQVLEQYPELYEKLMQRADAYHQAFITLLDMQKDAGMLSKESYDDMVKYKYVPMRYIGHMIEDIVVGDDLKINSEQSKLIKRLTGGSEENIDMAFDEALKFQAYMVVRAIAKNNAMQKIYEAAKSENFQGPFYEPDVTGVDADGNFKYGNLPAEDAIIYFFMDGKKMALATSKEIASAFNGSNMPDLGISDEALGWAMMTIPFRAVTTNLNPGFGLAQLILDIPQALLTNEAYSNITTGLPRILFRDLKLLTGKGLGELSKLLGIDMGFDKEWNELAMEAREYGGLITFTGMDNETMSITQAAEKAMDKKSNMLTNAFAAYRDKVEQFGTTMETVTRLAVYRKMRNNLISEYKKANNGKAPTGEDLDNIRTQAAATSLNVLNYNRGGVVVKGLNRALAYLNVAFQVPYSVIKYAKRKPFEASLKAMEVAMWPTLVQLLCYLSIDDDDDKEKYLEIYNNYNEYEKFNYWHMYNLLWDGKDPETMIVRIKKPTILLPLINSTEVAVMYVATGGKTMSPKDYSKNQLLSDIVDMQPLGWSLISSVPLFNAFAIYALNKDLYRNMDVVKNEKELFNWEEGQNDPNVGKFYKYVAERTKYLGDNDRETLESISPARMDAAVKAAVGNYETNITTALPLLGAEGLLSWLSSDYSEFKVPAQTDEETKSIMEKVWDGVGLKKRFFAKVPEVNPQIYKSMEFEKKMKNYLREEIRSMVDVIISEKKSIDETKQMIREYYKMVSQDNQYYDIENLDSDLKNAFKYVNNQKWLKDKPKWYRTLIFAPDTESKIMIFDVSTENMDREGKRQALKDLYLKGFVKEGDDAWIKYVEKEFPKQGK